MFVANPTIIEVKDHPKPIFKWYLHAATLDNSIGTFFHVLEGVVYVKDVRSYIHYHIEDLGNSDIKSMYMSELMVDSRNIKQEYQHIVDLGFTGILDILEFQDEIIRYPLRKLHGEFI